MRLADGSPRWLRKANPTITGLGQPIPDDLILATDRLGRVLAALHVDPSEASEVRSTDPSGSAEVIVSKVSARQEAWRRKLLEDAVVRVHDAELRRLPDAGSQEITDTGTWLVLAPGSTCRPRLSSPAWSWPTITTGAVPSPRSAGVRSGGRRTSGEGVRWPHAATGNPVVPGSRALLSSPHDSAPCLSPTASHRALGCGARLVFTSPSWSSANSRDGWAGGVPRGP